MYLMCEEVKQLLTKIVIIIKNAFYYFVCFMRGKKETR